MSKIFESLEQLVAAVVPGGSQSAFIGRYRNKDSFILAEDENDAMAVLAESMGMQVGLVPLDLLIKAASRNSRPALPVAAPVPAPSAPAPAPAEEGGPVAAPEPAPAPKQAKGGVRRGGTEQKSFPD